VADMSSGERMSISSLILVPALITLAITILRLVGELQHWPSPLFNNSAGGGGAIIGISWLPIIFGPYFAVKLSKSGDRPSSFGKTIGFAILGFVLMIGGGTLAFALSKGSLILVLAGLIVIAAGAAIQFPGWPGLAKTLIAYGYAARVPVAIVMFFAIRGNWGTHYDVVPPNYNGPTDTLAKWAFIGLVPQLFLWITYTMSVGALFGGIAAAITKSRQAQPQSTA
jgi:hypothetical protein